MRDPVSVERRGQLVLEAELLELELPEPVEEDEALPPLEEPVEEPVEEDEEGVEDDDEPTELLELERLSVR
ncbi:hypothetical protein K353_04842 [Kitasatospora sp. SolWspMP-SS2h]|nr:hypothetical protein K353_04842 [Kitasatospora sp. SolWspMP-SS2h]